MTANTKPRKKKEELIDKNISSTQFFANIDNKNKNFKGMKAYRYQLFHDQWMLETGRIYPNKSELKAGWHICKYNTIPGTSCGRAIHKDDIEFSICDCNLEEMYNNPRRWQTDNPNRSSW